MNRSDLSELARELRRSLRDHEAKAGARIPRPTAFLVLSWSEIVERSGRQNYLEFTERLENYLITLTKATGNSTEEIRTALVELERDGHWSGASSSSNSADVRVD